MSNLLQNDALFEFLALTVAEKMNIKLDWSSRHFFAKLSYCLVEVKSATIKFYPIEPLIYP